jgi:hypothetical protein
MVRPRGNRKEARLSVSLDERDYTQLSTLARHRDVSVAWMVRHAIHNLIQLEQDKTENPELPHLQPRRKRAAETPDRG